MRKSASRFDRVVFGIIIVLLVVGVIARVSIGGKKSDAAKSVTTSTVVGTTTTNQSTSTTKPSQTTTSLQQSSIPPFNSIAFTVKVGDKVTDPKCALLADTQKTQEQGMQGRKDMGGYDAMIFKFDKDSTLPFWMKDVPVPLHIFWFDASGNYVDQTTMAPCLNKGNNCPNYGSDGKPYRYAVEVMKGQLSDLSLRDGSSLQLGGNCA